MNTHLAHAYASASLSIAPTLHKYNGVVFLSRKIPITPGPYCPQTGRSAPTLTPIIWKPICRLACDGCEHVPSHFRMRNRTPCIHFSEGCKASARSLHPCRVRTDVIQSRYSHQHHGHVNYSRAHSKCHGLELYFRQLCQVSAGLISGGWELIRGFVKGACNLRFRQDGVTPGGPTGIRIATVFIPGTSAGALSDLAS